MELHQENPQRIQENAEDILKNILKTAEVFEDKEKNTKNILLRYGSKQIIVGFDYSDNLCVTYIETQKNNASRKSEETTFLYKATYSLIQKEANKIGQPIQYLFTTEIPTMIEWGKTKGNEIFSWTSQTIGTDELYANFRKTFSPITEENELYTI